MKQLSAYNGRIALVGHTNPHTHSGGFPICKVERKLYRCEDCGTEKMIETNHFHECYPWCDTCRNTPVWKCRELDFDIIIKRLEEEDNARQ